MSWFPRFIAKAACTGLFVFTFLGVMDTAAAFPDGPYTLAEKDARRFHLLADVAVYAGGPQGADSWTISPLFDFRLRLGKNLYFEGAWGLAHARLSPQNGGSSGDVRPGNPWGAVHYIKRSGRNTFRIGVGVTAPLALLPEDLNRRQRAQFALTSAAATRGLWNYWLWEPHSMSLAVPFLWEQQRKSGFYWGIQAAAGVMISISDRDGETDGVIQTGIDLGYKASQKIRVGGMVRLVILPVDDLQTTQLSAEPYLRYGTDRAFFAVRMLINIDEPHGFGYDSGEFYGLRIGGGVAF